MSKATEKIKSAFADILKKRDDKIEALEERLSDMDTGSSLKLQVDHVRIRGAVEIKKFPDVQKVAGDISVANFPKQQSVHIVNLKELGGLKVAADVKFPEVQDVRVMNEPSLKAEHWLPGVMARINAKGIEFLARLLEQGVKVHLDTTNPMAPMPVVMVDGKGREVVAPARSVVLGGTGGGAAKPYIPTGVGSGTKTVASPGTAVQLTSSATRCSKVYITAKDDNTGLIAIGGSNVSISGDIGALLSPLGSFTLDIDDVSKIWMDAGTASDGVCFTYVS